MGRATLRGVRFASRLALAIAFALPAGAWSAPEPLALGVANRQVPAEAAWLVRAPVAEKVMYRGAASFDDAAIGSMGMLYPAPNLIGLFAAIATHGLIADSAQQKKKSAIQEAADKVLLPYQPTLDTITHAALLPQGLARVRRGGPKTVVPAGDAETGQWLVETAPVFSMTQDQRALVLDNTFVVRGLEPGAPLVYQNIVRVVSAPLPAGGEQSPVSAAWLADEGRRLREQSAELLAESFELMLAELSKSPPAQEERPQRTFRYQEGGTVKMERAIPLVEHCERAVLKTLRGWLMSVPRPAGTEDCVHSAPLEKTAASSQ